MSAGIPTYKNCCAGRTVRVGLAAAPYKPIWDYNFETQLWSGYYPNLMNALSMMMGFTLEFVKIPMPTSITSNLLPVLDGTCDVTPMAGMTSTFQAIGPDQVFFVPQGVKESTYSGLVKKSAAAPGTFRLLDPLTPGLWLTIIASVTVASMLIVLIDFIRPIGGSADKKAGSLSLRARAEQFARAFYHVWAAVLGGEDYEWITMPARLLRLSLLFFILILVATVSPHAISLQTCKL